MPTIQTEVKEVRNATSFRIDRVLDEKIEKIAAREYLTKSDILRRALRFYFSHHE
jgi:predicted transcriptional regulator